jgi:hypothetical protein
MKLYMATVTEYTRHVIDDRFIGIPWFPIELDENGEFVRDENGKPVQAADPLFRCEFRDIPPGGPAAGVALPRVLAHTRGGEPLPRHAQDLRLRGWRGGPTGSGGPMSVSRRRSPDPGA